MSACARDLARFGEMLRNDGFYNDRQILPASWVRDTRLGNDTCANYSRQVTIVACYPMATTVIRCGQTANPMKSCAWHSRPKHLHQPHQATGLRQTVIHLHPADPALYGATYWALRALAAQI